MPHYRTLVRRRLEAYLGTTSVLQDVLWLFMAYVNWIVLHLSLLLFVAFSLGQKCPLECKCSMKKIKGSPDKLKVDCRGRGITEIYPQKEFPKDMEIL